VITYRPDKNIDGMKYIFLLSKICKIMRGIGGNYPEQREFGCSEKHPFGARISRLLNGSVRTPSEAIHLFFPRQL
jgi:hypothetical protein